MDNWLREFDELLDIALLKVQNRALAKKNPKWKEWWQTMQNITKEQIQESVKIVCVNEEAYLSKLVVYKV
jgi:L-rhamnose mutarotase